MIRTVNQSNRFHALLTQRKFDKDDKVELVLACTGGRETSSAKMTTEEMDKAIKHLEDEQEASIKRMRAKIIHIARDIFEMAPKDVWGQDHYNNLNVHLVRTCKKPLHKLTYDELPDAVTSMERWRDNATKRMVAELMGEPKAKRGRPVTKAI